LCRAQERSAFGSLFILGERRSLFPLPGAKQSPRFSSAHAGWRGSGGYRVFIFTIPSAYWLAAAFSRQGIRSLERSTRTLRTRRERVRKSRRDADRFAVGCNAMLTGLSHATERTYKGSRDRVVNTILGVNRPLTPQNDKNRPFVVMILAFLLTRFWGVNTSSSEGLGEMSDTKSR
jgi:hypothetical protein